MIEQVKMLYRSNGKLLKATVGLERVDGRLFLHDAPFGLKDDIKSMLGSKWHGREDPPRYVWSVKDCDRNNFQLSWMCGGNPYEWFERPLIHHEYERPLKNYQKIITDIMLTYHYAVIAAEMGLGKTLSGIECIERSGHFDWWWVAPKSALESVEREFKKWGLKGVPKLMTYDRLRIEMEQWAGGMPAPRGLFLDESHRAKGADSKRTLACQGVADAIRREHGTDGFVILLSGSPAPKSPLDLWSQCEIACPGFLKEGSPKAFEWRLRIFEKTKGNQGEFWKPVAWRDDEKKCNICGKYEDDKNHQDLLFGGAHNFVPSKNEVEYLKERTKGLVWTFSKEEWLPELPDMIFREVRLEPSSTIKRVAKALAGAAPTAIQGLTWLRELSDGFQYREVQDGEETCDNCNGVGECEAWEAEDGTVVTNDMQMHLVEGKEVRTVIATCDVCGGSGKVPHTVRETKEIPTPKEQAIRDLLDENDEQGRIILFAGFQGSIDRLTRICLAEKWDVIQVDGRGWKCFLSNDERYRGDKVMDYWHDMKNRRVAFVAHPESGGTGLTLTESRMAVFYSNDFKPDSRAQAMARGHRIGMDLNKGFTIVDLFHLPTDERVLNVLKDNRRLEKMTLDEFRGMVE